MIHRNTPCAVHIRQAWWQCSRLKILISFWVSGSSTSRSRRALDNHLSWRDSASRWSCNWTPSNLHPESKDDDNDDIQWWQKCIVQWWLWCNLHPDNINDNTVDTSFSWPQQWHNVMTMIHLKWWQSYCNKWWQWTQNSLPRRQSQWGMTITQMMPPSDDTDANTNDAIHGRMMTPAPPDVSDICPDSHSSVRVMTLTVISV